MKDGIILAAQLIDSGKAAETLNRLITVSNRPEEEILRFSTASQRMRRSAPNRRKDSCRRQKSGARHSHCPRTSSSSKTP